MTQDFLEDHPIPEYVRLLGLKRGCADLTKLFRESSLPIISKAADADLSSPLLQLDQKAYDLWALGAGLPAGLMLRQGVCIV